MKKTLYISFGLLVVVSLACALLPDLRDNIYWRLVLSGKVNLNSYIERWPEGRHFNEAMRLQEDQAWEKAVKTNTIQGYERYIDHYQDGVHKAMAKNLIESMQWENASNANTVSAYEKYLSAYPHGKFSEKAMVKLLILGKKGVSDFSKMPIKTAEYENIEKETSQQQMVTKTITKGSIVEFVMENKIEIKTQRQSTKEVEILEIQVRKQVSQPLQVDIPKGSRFLNLCKSLPDSAMVTKEAAQININQDDWQVIYILATCDGKQENIIHQSKKDTELQAKLSIREVQRKLLMLGYYAGPIDGVFGGATEKALRSFQVNNTIPQTGLLDKATLKKMAYID